MKLNSLDYLGIASHFTDEELMVQNTARDFCEKEIAPIIEEHYEKGTFPMHLVSQFAELGFLGVNIGPNKDTLDRVDDYLNCFKKFYNFADYITINISSPNTPDLRNLHSYKNLDELLNLIQTEKKNLNTKIPLALKVSPDIEEENISEISDLIMKHKLEIIIVSNSTDKNRQNLKNINKLEKGGLSGKPLENQSNNLINKFYKIFNGEVKIIGVGGIDSGRSAYEKFINGASLVQLYTGMVYKGPEIAHKISGELIDILKKKRVKNISEVIGIKN